MGTSSTRTWLARRTPVPSTRLPPHPSLDCTPLRRASCVRRLQPSQGPPSCSPCGCTSPLECLGTAWPRQRTGTGLGGCRPSCWDSTLGRGRCSRPQGGLLLVSLLLALAGARGLPWCLLTSWYLAQIQRWDGVCVLSDNSTCLLCSCCLGGFWLGGCFKALCAPCRLLPAHPVHASRSAALISHAVAQACTPIAANHRTRILSLHPVAAHALNA